MCSKEVAYINQEIKTVYQESILDRGRKVNYSPLSGHLYARDIGAAAAEMR